MKNNYGVVFTAKKRGICGNWRIKFFAMLSFIKREIVLKGSYSPLGDGGNKNPEYNSGLNATAIFKKPKPYLFTITTNSVKRTAIKG